MSDDPVPADFGWRYIGWHLYSNAITYLGSLQSVLAVLIASTDPHDPTIPHPLIKWIIVGNAVLTVIVARVKKNVPPGPPPTKEQKP